MTELEKLKHAKDYLEKMADGINPITNEQAPDEDIISHVRVSRCLFYVSDILRQVIENGGTIGKERKDKKQPFTLSQQEIEAFPLSNTPIPISEFTKRINELIDSEKMIKLKYNSITSFLLKSGFLVERQTEDGKIKKLPSEQGKALGITLEERVGQTGAYHVIVYNSEAQQFILDNIDAVIEENNQRMKLLDKQAENQGRLWTMAYDTLLTDLFQKKVPVSEIAVELKRTESGIRARLKRLGLIEKRSDAI